MSLPLQTLRRSAMHAMNDLGTYVASSGAATSFTSAALANLTSGASTTRLDGSWAFIATGLTGGQQRRTRSGGLTPSTGVQLIYHDWSAPVTGAQIDITRLFPSIDDAAGSGLGESQSYRGLVNKTLWRMPVPDQITLSTIAGQYAYDLSTYAAWLSSADRLLKVYGPPIVASYPARDDSFRVERLDFDGGVPTLRLRVPYAADSEAIRMDVVRPAATLISGVESVSGLVAETDTVLSHVREDEFLTVFLEEAYLALAHRGHDGADWGTMAMQQAPKAQAVISMLERRARGLPEQAPQPAAQGAAA